MLSLVTYGFYLAISLLITFRVGAQLNQYGLVFLTNQLDGNQRLALAINNLLLIGYYLINIGYILLILNLGGSDLLDGGLDAQLNFLTRNLGLVTLMLGGMHMILMYVLANWHPTIHFQADQQ